MITKEELHKLVDAFLAERRAADSTGWPAVGAEDVPALAKIVRALIDLKYDRDMDGDPVIEFELLDRNQYLGNRFRPVPYWWGKEHEQNFDDAVRAIKINLNKAQEYFNDILADAVIVRRPAGPIEPDDRPTLRQGPPKPP